MFSPYDFESTLMFSIMFCTFGSCIVGVISIAKIFRDLLRGFDLPDNFCSADAICMRFSGWSISDLALCSNLLT